MKFSCKTEINSPVQKVVKLWDNPDNLTPVMFRMQSQKWLDNFKIFVENEK